ncbi:hypothetical protein JX265_012018 [Neoarthrinium moseri]|uniref:SCP domain-containing protein n=1 Tax=Neoarthrinium moseri TaxID=1658444 RepID=A0A9Q0AJ32_9PEZI|nr:hypothetical protein JX266_010907 [Neoarthrinium moseri]KAI1855935.1 hypothetical protein JX265_012018 [Neoarthrinium moseri]
MRFSTALTLAAALMGVDASCGRGRRISTYPVAGGPPATTAPATTVAAPVPTTSLVPTTFATLTKTTEEAPSPTSAAPPAATTSAPPSTGLTQDQQNALDAHNSARSEIGSAALVWDSSLAADAQAWAEHLVSVGSLTHSDVSGQGENLYMGYDSTPLVSAANGWIAEKSSYNGEAISSTNYMSFGHYTQVVWGSTTHVGMGSASDSSGAVYVVARYSPPGNMIGETP